MTEKGERRTIALATISVAYQESEYVKRLKAEMREADSAIGQLAFAAILEEELDRLDPRGKNDPEGWAQVFKQ